MYPAASIDPVAALRVKERQLAAVRRSAVRVGPFVVLTVIWATAACRSTPDCFDIHPVFGTFRLFRVSNGRSMDVAPRRSVGEDMRESVVSLRESSLDVHKRAVVPGEGAHDVLPLAAVVGVSTFDVSMAANARRRVTQNVCKSG